MANVDELSIQIEASSEDAAKAIDTLVKGLENLNTALGNLDADKVSKFASAVSKLSSIGSSTNTTAKAIKDMANDIAGSFGIKTKKGIDDIVTSLQALYTTSRNLNLNDSLENQNAFESSRKSLQKAIEDNYRYVISVDERTKAIKEYVKAQNKSGSKIAMGDMAAEFGEDFENISKVLGKSFKNKLFDTEATSLQQFFKYMNYALNTSFKTGNDQELKQSVEDLVDILKNADDEVYKFGDAVSKGMLTGEEAADKTYVVIDKLFSLIKEQDKYSASSGLSGLADVFDHISNVHVPDMAGVADAIKAMSANPPVQTAKAVSDIGNAASEAATKAQTLASELAKILDEQKAFAQRRLFELDSGKSQNPNDYIPKQKEEPVLALPMFEKMLPAVIEVQSAVDGLYQRMMRISSVEAAYDAITEKFIEWKTQLMEMSGAIGGNKWATDSPVLALPEFEKQLPAVIDTENQIDNLYRKMMSMSSTEAVYDMLTQKFIEMKTQLMGMPVLALPEFEKQLPAVTRYSDAIRSLFEKDLGIDNVSQMLNKVNDKVENVGTTALALPEQFKTSTDYINKCLEEVGEQKGFENVAKQAAQAQSAIEKALQALRDYKQTLSDMESGKIPFDKDIYDNAVIGYAKATEEIKKYKDELLGVEDNSKKAVSGDILSNIVALGDALKKVSDQFGSLADKGISIFKVLTKPLQMAANEYVEKFQGMGKTVQNFRKKFNAEMTKMSQFWKRTMKTFTFMLVRKAIDAIVKEVGTAIQSLAMYSNAMGTAFNTDLSNMVADFQYLGRSIVSIFAPLLNAVIPIIDAIVDRIATLLSYIGMLFAALGGSTSFTKAIKNVGNYAESLDSASKSAKNLTMGIDELNILSESSGGGSAKPYDGWEDAWEDVEIPQWIQDLGDWFKDLWDKFFSPLKEAWDRAKQYLIDGFKTMVNSLRKLLGDIGNDFLEMWNQEKTIRMFEQILKIVGDLFRVVRNLANAFDEAWNYNKTGLHILENLRDILAILVDHARNISYYMIGWAKDIDFKPLLTSFEQLTNSAKRLADFIGGVVEDIFVYGILKYIDFLIEDAIPHLQRTIAEIIDTFNFSKIRAELRPLIEAVEEAFENIHTGVTNAIGNLGKEVARFANSSEFTKFLQTLTNLAKQITAARVEKVLTGLGKGILAIAKAVVKFVNSKLFQSFIKFIGDWIDEHSSDDIAKVLTAIANAILVFKFVEFTASKLAGVFQFFSVITALRNLGTIASHFREVGEATKILGTNAQLLSAASGAVSSFGSVMSTAFTGIGGILSTLGSQFSAFVESISVYGLGSITNALQFIKNDFGSLGSVFSTLGSKIAEVFSSGITAINNFAAGLSPLTTLIGSVTTAFLEWKGVSDSANQLAHAIDSGDENSIGGSVLGIIGKIGLASAAFTAFLGFPAGLVAGLCVGAVAAIKGIQGAIDEINTDHINDAILTQGDVTLAQINDMYSQSTAIITEHVGKWKEVERTLTQDKGDIDEYTKSLEGLTRAFESHAQITGGMIDGLMGKYSDLNDSIGNYIDDSTEAFVQQIMAQSDYLEAQGKDVDAMIANAYAAADGEKEVLGKLKTNMDEAGKAAQDAYEAMQKARNDFGEGSTEYETASSAYATATETYRNAVHDYRIEIQQFQSDVSSVDTSEAVSKIEALGKSFDLSKYANTDQAIEAVRTSIQTVTSEYTTQMAELKRVRDEKIENFRENPLTWWTQEDIDAAVDSAQREFDTSATELTRTTTDTLNLFQSNIQTKIEGVAKKAGEEWEKGGPEISGLTKSEYVNQLTQEFLNKTLGENGLQGDINKLYEQLPQAANQNVVTAMQTIVNDQWQAYTDASTENGSYSFAKGQQFDLLQGILNQSNDLDYDTPATVFNQSMYTHMVDSLNDLDFDGYGNQVMTETGNAISLHGQAIEDAARLESGEGVNAFADQWKTTLSPIAEDMRTMNYDYGKDNVQGMADGMSENVTLLDPSITTLFEYLDKHIHTNGILNYGSPNLGTKEYGKDLVTGLNLGITTNASTSITAIGTWFTYINAAIRTKLTEVKTTFNTMLTNIFSGAGWDYNSPITTLFTNVTMSITNNLAILGDNLLNNLLPMFMETYILPFFSIDRWQPLFDVLLNEVFMTSFTQFTEWFNTSMTTWWNEYLLIWFQPAKWNSEVFLPLQKNREQRYKLFIDWWVKSLKSWWEEKTMPYFKPTFWDEKVYIPLQKNREKHYKEFIDWWDKSLKDWWDNKTMPYFKDSYWDDEIYTPIKNNLHKHFEAFIKWWDETLEDWWNNHTKPYFEEELWRKLFTTVLDVSEDVFEKVKDAIQERIKDAAQSVADACSEMTSSLNDVLSLIGEVTEALKGFGDLGGAVTFNYSGEFATGGFPSAGSLFLAGETGAGAEFVGNIGGRTGVVSNGEITGIADAVYSTGNQESVLLAQLISLTQALLDKDPVVIGDKEIAEMANNGQSQLGMSIIS